MHAVAPAVGGLSPPASPGRDRNVLGVLMWLMLAGYLVWALAGGGSLSLTADGVLGGLSQGLPAVCMWAAFTRSGERRPELAIAAVGMTAFAAGNTYFVWLTVGRGGTPPFPSFADIGYLSFAPFMLGALVLTLRQQRQLIASMWLDSLVGGLGAAAGLAVLLSPVLEAALDEGSRSLGSVVSLAYPLADLLLVAAVTGTAALRGVAGRRTLFLIAGLLVFAVSDVVYALRLTAGTYEVGTVLDAGWGLGLALIASWVPGTRQAPQMPPAAAAGTVHPAVALLVPALATLTGVGVLIAGTRTHLSLLAVSLASLTLAAAAARTQLAFRQLVRLAEARRQATTDDLTGLPNRRSLYARVPAELRHPDGRPSALLLLDLDKFKEVNDSLGHHVGDRLLVEISRRLARAVREGDLLARLGGDEFAVLLQNADHDAATAVAATLRDVLAEPLSLEDITVHTEVSIGIALFPDHGKDLDALLRHADIAMYRAKTARDGFRVYDGADDLHWDERLRTLQDLRLALGTAQIVLHYQPKVELATGEVRGVEALVRWDHPERGLLYPADFLGLVEDAGLMSALTNVVIEQAVDQAARWRAAGRDLTVAVNVSASSLVDVHLPDRIAAHLAAHALPPSALQVEITEELLMADRDRARAVLTALRSNGVQIAVDDFGTGYSSLAYLRDLPIDELKLDRSFVSLADDARAAALVASVIGLAHSLGLRMVAEGVEDRATLAELTRYRLRPGPGLPRLAPVARRGPRSLVGRHSGQNRTRRPRFGDCHHATVSSTLPMCAELSTSSWACAA